MYWSDIASIVFVCVSANHLGLVKAIEDVIGRNLPIVDCPKCCTCWCVLTYSILATHDILASLAVSFLCSYIALWLELLEGFIDTIYLRVYDKIYTTTDDTASADADNDNSYSTVSEL